MCITDFAMGISVACACVCVHMCMCVYVLLICSVTDGNGTGSVDALLNDMGSTSGTPTSKPIGMKLGGSARYL